MDRIQQGRNFMKSDFSKMDGIVSDQQAGKPMPDMQNKIDENKNQIELVKPSNFELNESNLLDTIKQRRSRRKYTETPFTLAELSYLLYTTQGVQRVVKKDEKPYVTMRTVPSAGARHPFETYLVILNVEGIKPGIYRYLALDHKLIAENTDLELSKLKVKVTEMTLGQKFSSTCSALFIWCCVPYRAEWRYNIASHKAMMLDAGHICQNLYLACESIEAGTCAIAAYDQDKVDALLGIDGENEFSVYLSPAGKVV